MFIYLYVNKNELQKVLLSAKLNNRFTNLFFLYIDYSTKKEKQCKNGEENSKNNTYLFLLLDCNRSINFESKTSIRAASYE